MQYICLYLSQLIVIKVPWVNRTYKQLDVYTELHMEMVRL